MPAEDIGPANYVAHSARWPVGICKAGSLESFVFRRVSGGSLSLLYWRSQPMIVFFGPESVSIKNFVSLSEDKGRILRSRLSISLS
jgi:hypothetical protein